MDVHEPLFLMALIPAMSGFNGFFMDVCVFFEFFMALICHHVWIFAVTTLKAMGS